MSHAIPWMRGCIAIIVGMIMIIDQPARPLEMQPTSPIAPAGAQAFASPLASTTVTPTIPVRPAATATATRTVTPTMTPTPLPTFTPQPTFTPLPPTLPPTSTPIPVFGFGATSELNPVLIIGGIMILLIIVAALLLRRARQQRRAAQPTEPVRPIPPPALPIASLEFADASGSIVSLALNKPSLTLGRATDNDLVVPDSIPNADTISHHHAQFRRDQDDYIVRDLGSHNGLAVNGRHTIYNLLQDGDRIHFGGAEAIFRKPDGSAA